ncbi:MAG: MFS transporter [Planctomycetes bacterium]|nr:MFS transporter [Planctomycetota bacterium]
MRWIASCPPVEQSLFQRLRPLLLTLFLDLAGFSLVFPLFAELLRHYSAEQQGMLHWLQVWSQATFGVNDPGRLAAFFGGLLAALYSLLQFAVTPWWGRLSDRIGRRKVLLSTVSLSCVGYALWMIAGRFELFVLSRILCGTAAANISVASAAIADCTSREERSRGMGMMGAAIGLGFLVGPAIGGASALLPSVEAGAGWFAFTPFSIPAGIALALSLINLQMLHSKFQESLTVQLRGEAQTRSANPFMLFSAKLGTGIARINVAWLLLMTAFAGFESTLVFLLGDKLHWGRGQSALCMVWLGICSVSIQGGVVRRLVPRMGEKRLAGLGLALLIPGNLITALVDSTGNPLFLWIGISLIACGIGFLSPTLTALVSLRAPEHSQGLALGSFRSVGALGRALGPFLAAWLYFTLGAGAPYMFAAVLLLVPAVLLRRV